MAEEIKTPEDQEDDNIDSKKTEIIISAQDMATYLDEKFPKEKLWKDDL